MEAEPSSRDSLVGLAGEDAVEQARQGVAEAILEDDPVLVEERLVRNIRDPILGASAPDAVQRNAAKVLVLRELLCILLGGQVHQQKGDLSLVPRVTRQLLNLLGRGPAGWSEALVEID